MRRQSLTSRGSTDFDGLDVVLSAAPEAEVRQRWDQLVDSTSGGDVSQLSAWTSVRQPYGFSPLYVLVRDGTAVLGGAQILYRRLPVVGEVGYVPYGPVVTTSEDVRPAVLEAVDRALLDLARTRFRMLFVQPARDAADMRDHLVDLGFCPSTADLAPPGSIQLDLTLSDEELLARLNSSLRRGLRKAQERGLRVRIGDHHDVAVLAQMMAATAQHRGFDALSENYIGHLYAELAPAGHAAIFVGEADDRPVACSLVTACADMVVGRLVGMDRSDQFRPLRAPSAIEWEAILWAKSNGYRRYDLGGIAEPPLRTLVDDQPGDRESWDGADRFKLQFGGTAYRYPAPVEWIRPPALRHAYNLSRRFPAGRAFLAHMTQRLRGGRSHAVNR